MDPSTNIPSGLLAAPASRPAFSWGGLLGAVGEDAAAARDWFIQQMLAASGRLPLAEGQTDIDQRGAAGMNLAAAAMTGAAPGGVFAAPRGAALGAGPIRAYHGSPHDFDRFDINKIGTGEGAQAYGHGLYFAERQKVAEAYRKALAGDTTDIARPHVAYEAADGPMLERTGWGFGAINEDGTYTLIKPNGGREINGDAAPKYIQKIADELLAPFAERTRHGRVYEVAIHADPARFLDWDKPLKAQPGLLKAVRDDGFAAADNAKRTGGDFYRAVMDDYGADPDQISLSLRDIGIPGIRYLDAGSRGAGDGSRNYVVFDDKLIEILRKYGLLPVALGGGAVAAGGAQPGGLLEQ